MSEPMQPKRFLPPDGANEFDVDDVEAYIRATVRYALAYVTDLDEIDDFVAQGLLINEEVLRERRPDESFLQALAAKLPNALRDYWRTQHPEVRRNTRARYRAAARGEE